MGYRKEKRTERRKETKMRKNIGMIVDEGERQKEGKEEMGVLKRTMLPSLHYSTAKALLTEGAHWWEKSVTSIL